MIDQNTIIVIAEFLGKSAILIAVGFVFVLVFRRLSPAAKHTLMLRVFTAGLVIPLLWLMFPRWEVIPSLSADLEGAAPEITASTGAVSIPTNLSTVIAPSPATLPTDVKSNFRLGWPELVFALWALGMVVFLIRSLVAAHFLRKLEREAKPANEDVSERFTALRAGICPKSKVLLLESSVVNSAFTWGIIRQRIVLPEGLVEWPSVDLEMILMHELEHVRRRDALAVLISRVFLALNWVNPLAWIAVRKTGQLREEACDRRVLQSGYPGQNYAEMLFRQASVVSSPIWRTSATAVAENGTIEQRIKMILNPQNEMKNGMNDTSLINKVLPTALILIVFLVGVAGFAEGEKSLAADDETKAKMENLILPKVEFKDTPLSSALMFLQQRSVELDPEKKGIVILDTRKRGKDFGDPLITLKLSNVPIEEVLRYTTALAQVRYSLKDGALVVASIEKETLLEMRDERNAQAKSQPKALIDAQRKMKEIRIPSIEFRDTPLVNALEFLQQRSVELDVETKDRAKKGVNVILDGEGGNTDVRITLRLTDVPLSEAFRYTASLAQAKFEIEPHAVRIFFPKSDGKSVEEPTEHSVEAKGQIESTQKKLNEIVLPAVQFSETPLADALKFIQQRSVELDTAVNDEGMKGINIVLVGGNAVDDVRVTLKLSNTSLDTVLKYTATSAGGEIEIGPNAVVVRIPEE